MLSSSWRTTGILDAPAAISGAHEQPATRVRDGDRDK